MVFVLIANDFDESLMSRGSLPGYHYFDDGTDQPRPLKRVDYESSWLRSLARHSALARHLRLNGTRTWASWAARLSKEQPRFVGNTSSSVESERLAKSQVVVDRFLEELPRRTGLSLVRIALVLDGFRPNVYDEYLMRAVQGTYWDRMRRYVIERAADAGIEVLDLQPRFVEAFERDGDRFDYHPLDGRWDAHGHEIAAQAVRDSELLRRTFAEASSHVSPDALRTAPGDPPQR